MTLSLSSKTQTKTKTSSLVFKPNLRFAVNFRVRKSRTICQGPRTVSPSVLGRRPPARAGQGTHLTAGTSLVRVGTVAIARIRIEWPCCCWRLPALARRGLQLLLGGLAGLWRASRVESHRGQGHHAAHHDAGDEPVRILLEPRHRLVHHRGRTAGEADYDDGAVGV